MSARKLGFVFTDRHETILKYLFRNKVATYRQLHDDLFASVKKSVVSRHLGKLMNDKRITKSLVSVQGKYTQVYSLDDGAIELIENCNKEEMVRHQLQSGTIEHDIHLVELRRKLSRSCSVINYHSENELQCMPEYRADMKFAPFIQLKSDAVIEVPLKKGPALVPVELEISQKSSARYDDKILEYYKHPSIRGVLFVAGNTAIENMVRKSEEETRRQSAPKFFYAQLNRVLTAEKEITFQNLSGEQFILK